MRPWPVLLPLLYAGTAFAWQPATGRVVVQNNAGVDVWVKLPDRSAQLLPVGRRLVADVAAGDAVVKASYMAFNTRILLERDRLNVAPGGVYTVVLRPEDEARVLVTNATPIEADLMIGANVMAHLLPGAQTIIATRPGLTSMSLVANGRALASTRMDLRPYTEPVWTVNRPATAQLVVTNPLPMPIRVAADGRGSRVVDAFQRTVFDDLPIGMVRVTATRLSGERVDDDVFDLRYGSTASWRVDAPITGLVRVDSEHGRTVWVGLDGWNMGSVAPWGEAVVEVPVGWQRLIVTDDRGFRVEDDWVEVRPYEIVTMRAAIGGPQRPSRPPWDGYAANDPRRPAPHDNGWHGEHHDGDGCHGDHHDDHGYGDHEDDRYDDRYADRRDDDRYDRYDDRATSDAQRPEDRREDDRDDDHRDDGHPGTRGDGRGR